MSFFELAIPALVILGLCLLGMAVGVIFRGKSFKSCGCASIEFRGERIDCPACVREGTEAAGVSCERRACEAVIEDDPSTTSTKTSCGAVSG